MRPNSDDAAPSRRDNEELRAGHGDLPGWRPAAWRQLEARLELEAWLTGATAAIAGPRRSGP